MPKYYKKMHKLMEIRNFSPSSISCYLHNMKQFARHHDKLLETITEQDILDYLFYLKTVRRVSASTIHVALSVIKFFYLSVLEQKFDFSKIPFPKLDKKLPVVLNTLEIKSLLNATHNLKHKTIFNDGLFKRSASI